MTVTICHAASDAGAATELQRYLLENLGGEVCRRLVEGSVREAVDFGLSGDRVIVLLSPGAEPQVEEGWQDVLLHQSVFYLWARSCRFPPLIRRNLNRFADARDGWLGGLRMAKRWLLGNDIHPATALDEDLCREICDRPGWTECEAGRALRFAQQHAGDFDRVIRIDGRGRTVPSVMAEMAHQLGASRRVLIVLEGATPDLACGLDPPAFTSVLKTPAEPSLPPDEAGIRSQLVAALNHRGDVDEPAFDRALQASGDLEFIRLAVAWLKRNERLVEALSVLDQILRSRLQLSDLARERAWIQERLRMTVDPIRPADTTAIQLVIPFDQR